MEDEKLITVIKNPSKPQDFVAKLFFIRLKGNALYVLLFAFLLGMFLAAALFKTGILLSVIGFILPPALSVVFINKFIKDKPSGYLDCYIHEILSSGNRIRKIKKKQGKKD